MDNNVIQFSAGPKVPPAPPPASRELKLEVKTFHLECRCIKCNQGYMRSIPLTEQIPIWNVEGHTSIPKFRHKCTNEKCDAEESFEKQYPTITYEYV